jgi:hypothetical protein
MSVKTLIVAAGLVAGATTAASAQQGWVGVAGPGRFAYGFGCYGCSAGTGGPVYDQAVPQVVPNGALLDYAGPPLGYSGLVADYAPLPYDPYASGPLHTGSNYLWFRPDGPGRGNSAESER